MWHAAHSVRHVRHVRMAQALLVLAYLRKGETFTDLTAGSLVCCGRA
jgi:hypothetical protein